MTELEAIDWCEQFRDNIIATGVEKETYTLALKAMRTAITALNNQVASSKWIPVTERLPNEDGTYLVCTAPGTVTTARFYAFKSFPATKHLPALHRSSSWQSNRNVTHWMPLPEAPKGE